MDETILRTQYKTVCDAPGGDGLQIDNMPDFFDEDPMDNSVPHVHAYYEIIWFREAGGVHSVDFQDYEVKKDMLFFLSPGQVHHFDGTTRHKGVIVRLCTDFFREENRDEDIFIKYNVFNAFDSLPYCTVAESWVAAALYRLIDQMREEQSRATQFGHNEMLRSFLKIFMVYIHRYGRREGAATLETARPAHRLFVRFRKALEQEFDKLHTVKEYADMLSISSKTLSNSVTECAGKAPLSFINDRIILEAKRLLRFTDMMIKEIAFRLGYDDPSYFVKFFKRETGTLPSEFREMNFNTKNITMKKIAVPTREGAVDDHFGHCAYYTIFSINDQGEVIKTENLDSPQGCGCKSNIASVMQSMGITLMLAGNMGEGAYNKLNQHGIEVIRGCKGDVNDVVRAYLDGKLSDNGAGCADHNCHELRIEF